MKSNIGFAGNSFSWFIGQVPSCQSQYSKDLRWHEAHGDRVKVRIPGKHSVKQDSLEDDVLPWAIVAKPTSQGNRNGGSIGIWGGEWVIGFFLDEGEQIPIITHVLGNNETLHEIKDSSDSPIAFKKLDRYNCGMEPEETQITGGTKNQTKPSAPALPTRDDFPSTTAVMIPVYDADKTYNVGDKVMKDGEKRVFDGFGWAAG